MESTLLEIAGLEQEIRDLINEPHKSKLLRRQGHTWSQLCTSLDVIGDSRLAIDAFPVQGTDKARGEAKGALYLYVYGLLQACFLQQDAIHHLCEALSLEDTYKDHPQLIAIRELRNDTVGHPSKRHRHPPHRYCSISRNSLSPAGFKMLTEEAGQATFRHVSLIEIIADQRTYIRELLASILAKLRQEVAEHKEKFKMETLVDLFPPTMGYAFEKVSQGIYESGPERANHAAFGFQHLQVIRAVLTAVREALGERGMQLDPLAGAGYLFEEVRYPIERLAAFLQAKHASAATPIDEETAALFVFFLRAKVDEIREIAREIDEEYEPPGVSADLQ